MKVVAKAAVLGLAGLTAFGAAGCNRGGSGGGTTTIIQQGGAAVASSSGSSPGPASVGPINDSKELCHQVLLKTRGLSNALSSFWKITSNRDGWSYTDSDLGDVVSRVEKEFEQAFPALDGIVGKGVSVDIFDAANNYLKTIKSFSTAITEQQHNDKLNPAASDFGHAKDKLSDVCSATG
ncbi:MAG: hypothetical protein ACRC20_13770 [Segniliparus sp.]|uniref:hypothetical protein n=1 Tax=Segniliparus sp. TaxID=2804064 RepID=UPI003F349381